MPNPGASKQTFGTNCQLMSLQTNNHYQKKLKNHIKYLCFYNKFQKSGGNLRDIEMRNLIAKFEHSSFNTEGTFRMTDRRTSKNNSTLLLRLL